MPDLSNKTNILYLDCSHNKLGNLDNLPPNLEVLKCDNNKLTRLDNLPANLIYLNCSNNDLTNLDNFEGTKGSSVPLPLAKIRELEGLKPSQPYNLQTLNCFNNKLQNLDFLPYGLQKLECGYN